VNKCDTSIWGQGLIRGTWQGVQNPFVKNKGKLNRLWETQGMGKGSVVF